LEEAMTWAFFPHGGPSTESIVKSLKSFRKAPPQRNFPKATLLLLLSDQKLASVEADLEVSQSRTELRAVRAVRAALRPVVSKLRAEMAPARARTRGRSTPQARILGAATRPANAGLPVEEPRDLLPDLAPRLRGPREHQRVSKRQRRAIAKGDRTQSGAGN